MKRALGTASLSFAAGAGIVAVGMLLGRAPGGHPAGASPDPLAVNEAVDREFSPPEADLDQGEPHLAATPATGVLAGSEPAPSAGSVEVELTGFNYHWEVRYLAPPGRFDTGAAQRPGLLYLPAASDVRLRLKSRDFVYLLSLPRSSRTQVAVPGREFLLDFRTGSPGTVVLRGDHLCGLSRPSLNLTAVIEPAAAFRPPAETDRGRKGR